MSLTHDLRAAWRLLRVVLHAVHGLALVRWRFGRMAPAQRHAAIGWWARKLLRVMGIGLEVQGRFAPGAKLLVANHVSWLDIMAVHTACPEARFVSKADVQHWPLIGALVTAAGTLYLQREKRRDAMRVVHDMAAALQAGDTVAVFPEGTTGDGRALLPLHANLLQAALVVHAPVQPVALRYADATHAISPAAEFLGDTTLAQSLWRLLCAQGLRVQVTALPALPAGAHTDRRTLAEALRQHLEKALG